MNKTKIIATIGPSSNEEEIIKQMIVKGLDVIRINLTHADHVFCKDIIDKVNKLNKELNTNVAIMLDTKGPDIRVGEFINDSAFLKEGDKIRIYMEEILGDNTKFSVSYSNLINDVKEGTILKLNDGLIELQVENNMSDCLICRVIKEGIITNNKSLNVPGICLKRPFLSKKDHEDIIFANKVGADFLALSFISNVEDILQVNDILIEIGNDHMGIIAKIENQNALEDLDEIIKASDGVMIARGDLGVEVPMEKVPGIQKNIINKCHQMGKVSIVATELMSSMEFSTRPTRAEVSDIVNAVLDGCDAVLLSGETTNGKHPVETLEILERILESAELDVNYNEFKAKAMVTEGQNITGMLSHSVVDTADRLNAKAIIAPTNSGYTARKMSRFRPTCPVIAASPDISTVKSLSLHFGVYPVLIDELNSLDKIISRSKAIASKIIDIKKGDIIIITGGYPFKEVKHTNFMKIEEL